MRCRRCVCAVADAAGKHNGDLPDPEPMWLAQTSMYLISRYALPYLCCLGLGALLLIWAAAGVLICLFARMLLMQRRMSLDVDAQL